MVGAKLLGRDAAIDDPLASVSAPLHVSSSRIAGGYFAGARDIRLCAAIGVCLAAAVTDYACAAGAVCARR